eukprot:TRINITY_DN2528_c1_g1_i1.p1 TRINITY_DN2528_c1_g1~~TRINITY_DN2528_c1_g1_i1.p1  ORF type:complete len:473 (-),score=69.92 TRINITY_DN2528_c1_g1_i1:126-1544(-)
MRKYISKNMFGHKRHHPSPRPSRTSSHLHEDHNVGTPMVTLSNSSALEGANVNLPHIVPEDNSLLSSSTQILHKSSSSISIETLNAHPHHHLYTTGIYSKNKNITFVRCREDLHKSVTWHEMVAMIENLGGRVPQSRNSDIGDNTTDNDTQEKHHVLNYHDDWKHGPIWIDFQGYEAADFHDIEHYFGIHHLTIEDILTHDTREKYEKVFNHDYHHVVINELHYKEYSNVLNSSNLSILLYKNFILTFHENPLLCVHQVVRMLEYCPGKRLPSADWVLYALLDGIIDLYVMLVEQTILEAESLDDLVLVLSGIEQNELLSRIGLASRRASNLYSGLWNKREILGALTREDSPISKNNKIYMQNVFDHLLRIHQKLKLARETLGSLNNIYMAKVNLELTVSSNQVNVVMRKFGAVSIIFMPLTLITGVFGMNVRVPGMIGTDLGPMNWFWGIISFFVAFGVTIAFIFYRERGR